MTLTIGQVGLRCAAEPCSLYLGLLASLSPLSSAIVLNEPHSLPDPARYPVQRAVVFQVPVPPEESPESAFVLYVPLRVLPSNAPETVAS
jgi:hypothetical protein